MSHIYRMSDYGRLIADRVRTDAYVRAIRAAIKPGDVVLDLGSGPGLFAMLACQMGARRVYAIEPNTVMQIARDAAAANGMADRIEFFNSLSTHVSLPERADVIVSDLHGPLPFYEEHIPSIRDARQRLLAEGGTLIPEREFLWAAIVEVPDEYEKLVGPWLRNDYGIDLTAAIEVVTNNWKKSRLKPEHLLVEPIKCQTLNYHEVEDANLSADILFSVNRSGIAHGLGVWFDSDLFQGIAFSNAPGSEELIYGQGLFFFPDAIEVSAGDQIEVRLTAHLHADYVWSWNTRIFAKGDKNKSKADFKQSTFLGSPILLEQTRKRAATHTPQLNPTGQIQEFVLSKMEGSISLEAIARELITRFPKSFHDYNMALAHVAQLSVEYSR